MNAEIFVRSFMTEIEFLAADSEDKQAWTEAMTQVLRNIGEAQKHHVHCHMFDGKKVWQPADEPDEHIKRGEFLKLDASYWSILPEHSIWKTVRGTNRRFHCHPLVCIEHENYRRSFAAKRDFNKVCLFALPLRVFIGYGADWQKARAIGEELQAFYMEKQLRQIANGQTLIIMSRRPRKPDDPWYCWLKNGEEKWQELGPDGNRTRGGENEEDRPDRPR